MTNDVAVALDGAFHRYAEAAVRLHFEQFVARIGSQRSHAHEVQSAQLAVDRDAQPGNRSISSRPLVPDLESPVRRYFELGTHGVEDDQVQEAVVDNFHQACRWTLAAAYEVYEDFVGEVYAILGQARTEFLRPKDTKDLTAETIRTRPPEWFYELGRRATGNGAHHVVAHLRGVLPRLIEVEKQYPFEWDLPTLMKVVEQLRHYAVHRRGRVDQASIWKMFGFNVPPTSPPADPDPAKGEAYRAIQEYVRLANGEHVVWLLDLSHPLADNGLVDLPLRHLLDVLHAHAALLHAAAVREFGGTPYWRRESPGPRGAGSATER